MKKIFLLFGLFFITNICNSQIFVTFDPNTLLVGSVTHIDINNSMGCFCGFSFTTVDCKDEYSLYLKYSVGGSILINDNFNLLIGYTHHHLNNKFKNDKIDLSKIKTNSVELGFICKLTQNLYTITLTDPINWQTQLGIGVRF